MAAAGLLPPPLTLRLGLLVWWSSPLEQQAAAPTVERMTRMPDQVFDAKFREVRCGCMGLYKCGCAGGVDEGATMYGAMPHPA